MACGVITHPVYAGHVFCSYRRTPLLLYYNRHYRVYVFCCYRHTSLSPDPSHAATHNRSHTKPAYNALSIPHAPVTPTRIPPHSPLHSFGGLRPPHSLRSILLLSLFQVQTRTHAQKYFQTRAKASGTAVEPLEGGGADGVPHPSGPRYYCGEK